MYGNNKASLSDYPQFVMYGLLTAFALYFSVQLTDGELSMAHVVGMMAFLAYPADVNLLIGLVIFVGGIGGGLLMVARTYLQLPSQRRIRANVNTILYVTARVTVSYFVASSVYLNSGSPLPLNDVNDPLSLNQLTRMSGDVLIFAGMYIALYTAIFAIQLYSENYRVLETFRSNFATIIVILGATVPFAILAALAPPATTSIVAFAIVIAGAMFSVFGLHALSRINLQMQKQLDEMRALSRISQALTGNLNLESLLHAIYGQIHEMLNIENFTVVLYSSDLKHIQYSYVIRNNNPQKLAPNEKTDDHNLIQRVLVRKTVLRLQDHVQDEALVQGLTAPADLCSWVGVPLLSGGDAIGALIISSFDPDRRFTAEDERLLTIIAGNASIAIENAHLYEQKSQRAEQLATLNKVATLLSGTLLPDNVIDIIISSASTISNATAVALYLPSAGTKFRLQLIRSAGLSAEFNEKSPQPLLTGRLNSDLDGTLRLSPIIIENIRNLTQSEIIRAFLLVEKKQAWIELPITIGTNNIGAIVLYFDEPQTFNEEQIGVMKAFAMQATQAINNAQTYAFTDEALERRIEQLYALAAMGRLLNATMDSQKICDVVLNYASDATKAERGFVAMIRSTRDHIENIATRDYDRSAITPDVLSEGINGHILDTRQAFRSDDVRLETGYLPLVPNTRSLIVVPLLRGKDLLGLIRLESSQPRAFSDGDVHFVSQIANQAVIAMDNTLLFHRIRNARDSLQTILDGMEDAIIMIDKEQTVTLANPSVAMLGLDGHSIVHQSVDDLMKNPSLKFLERLGFKSKDEVMQVLNYLNNSNQWRILLSAEYDLKADDGNHVYIKRQVIPVQDEDDGLISGVLLVFYNKTEERQLAHARDSLSQMIVHDLRSPLTAVTTSLALLKSVGTEDPKLSPILEKTTFASQQAIQKVLSRINSLLDISKMESGEIDIHNEPSELATIVDNVLIELSPIAHDQNVTLQNNIPATLPLLDIDSDKVERVLQNLIDNALKYSPTDSQVTLRARYHSDENMSKGVRIDIIDCGPGIPDDYKQSIFNRYVQLKGNNSHRRGVGLGLTFCRMVTEAHGGKIWIEDNPEGGSIFSLTLPTVTKARKLEGIKN